MVGGKSFCTSLFDRQLTGRRGKSEAPAPDARPTRNFKRQQGGRSFKGFNMASY